MAKPSVEAETCRVHARECRFAAAVVIEDRTRREFLELARDWEWMARDIEQIEKMRGKLAKPAGR